MSDDAFSLGDSPRVLELRGWTQERIRELADEIATVCNRLTDEVIEEMRDNAPSRGIPSALTDTTALRTAVFTMFMKAVVMRIVQEIPVRPAAS